MTRVVHYLPKRIPPTFKAILQEQVGAGVSVVIVRDKR